MLSDKLAGTFSGRVSDPQEWPGYHFNSAVLVKLPVKDIRAILQPRWANILDRKSRPACNGIHQESGIPQNLLVKTPLGPTVPRPVPRSFQWDPRITSGVVLVLKISLCVRNQQLENDFERLFKINLLESRRLGREELWEVVQVEIEGRHSYHRSSLKSCLSGQRKTSVGSY